MATSNTALRVTELDFDSIKENLKNYLRSQAEFQDFDFEGSGMSVLLDILAYNTHYMGYYLNMVGNEMFLDTAQLRNSIVSHSKSIGYVPTSVSGAQALITVRVTPSEVESNTTNILSLDKYTRFLGENIDGISYPFVTVNSNTVSKVNGTFTFANVYIKQGEVVTNQYLVQETNTTRRFDIPSANIDTDTLLVTVQESSSNTFTTEYTLADDITEVRANSTVYFLEENNQGRYTFYFGDDYIGKKPKVGNIINVTYLNSVGSLANNISNYTPVDSIGGLYTDNVIVTTTSSSYGGTDKETIEQVRFRAPYAYTTQNRAVTALDYETLVTKDYNNIDAVSVWGGEDNDPPIYGKVFLSIKPKGNYYLSNLDKERITNDLIRSRNVLTVIPEIVDPEYVYLLLKVSVTYNPSLTSLSEGQVAAYVRAAISDYKDRELDRFDSTFRKSKLQSYIESSEKSITGSDVTVFAQKRVLMYPNETRNYEFPFSLPISKGDYTDKLSTFPQIKVIDLENVTREVFFEEVPNSFTGIDSITILRGGRNYTDIPTVTISGDGTGATARAEIINGVVDRIIVTNKGANYTRATVSITGGNGREASAIPVLQAKNGIVRSYYFKSNGEKIIVNDNAGTIDYETGFIKLNSLYTTEVVKNNYYFNNYLTMSAPLAREIIQPLRNRILTLDENDQNAIQIEMVAER